MWYLDTSAFLKLIVSEEETEAMRDFVAEVGDMWSSQLLVTESLRGAARLGIDGSRVIEALDTVSLVMPGAETFFTAGELGPSLLRSLDAIHLATALELGSDLNGMVTYDVRQREACVHHGIEWVTPGGMNKGAL
ncbi:MAG: type II toxin-antitoxin system VapC family toxin [Actinomycetes bacterium]